MLTTKVPVLGICYGAQLMAKQYGGVVAKSNKREYGRATMQINETDELMKGVAASSQVWMSHSDSIKNLPEGFEILGHTESIPVAAFKSNKSSAQVVYGLQFHPEVYHSTDGKTILRNF